MMHMYLIERGPTEKIGRDEILGAVIRAQTPSRARKMIAEEAMDEKADAWTSSDRSTLKRIAVDVPGDPEIILCNVWGS